VLRKEPGHLLGRLDVELLAGELHPLWVVVELAGADAQEHVVHPGIAPGCVVGVVGGDEVYAGLFVEPDQTVVHPLLLGDLQVVLHFQVDRVEDLRVLEQELPRLIQTPFENARRHLGTQAS
jgi:hypothetical protein